MNASVQRSISVAGLLEVESGGSLTGNSTITVQSGGVLRAGGSGVSVSGLTTISGGGALEIGSSNVSGDSFTLNGDLVMATGSELRINLFGALDYDSIHLAEAATLLLSGSVKLELLYDGAPEAGAVYSLFTGETSGISGSFDVSHYDPAVWNFSGFNEAGGWRVAVIPEPSSVVLTFGVGALLIGRIRRKVASA